MPEDMIEKAIKDLEMDGWEVEVLDDPEAAKAWRYRVMLSRSDPEMSMSTFGATAGEAMWLMISEGGL